MSKFNNIFIGLFITMYLLFNCQLSLYGNSIIFRDSNEEIHVETTEMGTDNLTALMSKGSIYGVTLTFSNHDDYPDAIMLMDEGNVPCKIIKMFDSKILVDFPNSWVKSLRIDFSGDGYQPGQESYNQGTSGFYKEDEVRERYSDHRQGRTESFVDNDRAARESYRNNQRSNERNIDRYSESNRNNFAKTSYYDDDYDRRSDDLGIVMLEDELEEENQKTDKSTRAARSDVKDWLLSEIRNVKSEGGSSRQQSSRTGNRQTSGGQQGEFDLLDKTLRDESATNNKQASGNNEMVQFRNGAGIIKGRFLHSGDPLASCKVRLVKLRKVGLVYYKDTEPENATPIEVSTDRYGTFVFNSAKPGSYKLYWKPPSESSWIRRVSMEPDVIVTSGEVAYLDDIETNQRILN